MKLAFVRINKNILFSLDSSQLVQTKLGSGMADNLIDRWAPCRCLAKKQLKGPPLYLILTRAERGFQYGSVNNGLQNSAPQTHG